MKKIKSLFKIIITFVIAFFYYITSTVLFAKLLANINLAAWYGSYLLFSIVTIIVLPPILFIIWVLFIKDKKK